MRFSTFYLDGRGDEVEGTLEPLGNGKLVSGLGHVRFKLECKANCVLVRHLDRIQPLDEEARVFLEGERGRLRGQS